MNHKRKRPDNARSGYAVLIALLASCNYAPDIPLNAQVKHTGGYFEITNNDTYSWGNCDLDLNSDYSMKGVKLIAGQTFRIPAREFTKNDGTRFNFFTTKPQQLYIYCRNTPFGTRSTLVGWK